jgi:hypothetical protein
MRRSGDSVVVVHEPLGDPTSPFTGDATHLRLERCHRRSSAHHLWVDNVLKKLLYFDLC